MKRLIVGLGLLTTVLAVAPARAAVETLQLHEEFLVHGAVLAPGDYTVEVGASLDTVTLRMGRRIVASVPCRVSSVKSAFRGVEVHSRPASGGHDEIVRLVFAKAGMAIDLLPAPVAEQPVVSDAGARR